MSYSKSIQSIPFLFCVLKKQTAGQYNTWLLKATILLQHVAFCWCEDLVVFCPNPCYEASPIFNISRTSFSLHFRGHSVCRRNIALFPLCWTWIALSPIFSFPQNWHWPLQGWGSRGELIFAKLCLPTFPRQIALYSPGWSVVVVGRRHVLLPLILPP